ncbi:MAG: FG-GAP-like repeat-containing protein [Planctomycetota bacterium]
MYRVFVNVVLCSISLTTVAAAQQLTHSWSGTFVEGFGVSASSAGDLDGDGLPDILVGSDGSFVGPHRYANAYSGSTGALLWQHTFESLSNGLIAVGAAGDVNADGFDDVILGAFAVDGFGLGRARLVSGVDGSTMYEYSSQSPYDGLGWSVCGAGDLNGDGLPEYAVGCVDRFNQQFPPKYDRVKMYLGINGRLYNEQIGETLKDRFGFSIASAGDVNNDGSPDLIAGAPQFGFGEGFARVLLSGVFLGHRFTGLIPPTKDFGWAVGTPGDYNHDGYSDLIVGAPSSNLQNEGYVYLFNGATGLSLGHITSGAANAHVGNSVYGLGDPNLDGWADFGIAGSSEIALFSGPGGVALLWPSIIISELGNPNYGAVSSNVGDGDGDGVPEIVLRKWFQPAPSTVDVVSLLPKGTQLYGTSTPNCRGPKLLLPRTQPVQGNGLFKFASNGIVPMQRAVVLVSSTPDLLGSDAFGVGLLVYIDINALVMSVPLVPGLPGYGTASFPIPNEASLVGMSFYAQGFYLAKQTCQVSPQGLGASNAVAITIQPL